MTKTQQLQHDTFHRVSNFGKANTELFPASSTAGQAFAEVADAAARIDALLVAKPLAAEGGQTKADVRAALHDAMRAITRTARGLPLIGIQNTLRLPRNQTDRQVIAAAKVFIEKGEAVQHELASLGLPATWLIDLREAASRLNAAIAERSTGHRQSSQAQQGILEAIAHGVHAIRRLDIVVPNKLEQTPELLAGWRRDRGGPLGRRRRAPAASPEPAPAGEGADDPLRRAS